jgi:hypothetical protein
MAREKQDAGPKVNQKAAGAFKPPALHKDVLKTTPFFEICPGSLRSASSEKQMGIRT